MSCYEADLGVPVHTVGCPSGCSLRFRRLSRQLLPEECASTCSRKKAKGRELKAFHLLVLSCSWDAFGDCVVQALLQLDVLLDSVIGAIPLVSDPAEPWISHSPAHTSTRWKEHRPFVGSSGLWNLSAVNTGRESWLSSTQAETEFSAPAKYH